ncbi:transposase, partial [Allochromatium humboldtianum]
MLIAHKIELRPTPEQAAYLNQACGARRHCYNQLLAHFSQPGVKWSKAAAYQHYISKRAGRFYVSILVDTEDYNPQAPDQPSVGVDFGIKDLATLSR